jgi:hypothetical protein
MRVLPNTYYRIELPGITQEDLEHVELLKKTLAKVLYYERTACPFQRGFGHDLPEMPSRNSRRLSREFIEPAKRWTLNKVWRPEGAGLEEPQLLHATRSTSTSDTERSEVDDNARSEEEGGKEQDTRPASRDKPPQLSGPFPSKKLAAMRSVTAPPQLSLESSPPSKVNKVRKMAGIFDQSARDTAPSLTRPLSSALAPRLPPTPESADDHDLPLNSPDYHIHEDITSEESVVPATVNPVAIVAEENDHPNFTEPLIIVEQIDEEPVLDQSDNSNRTDHDSVHEEAGNTILETSISDESREQAVAGATETIEEEKEDRTPSITKVEQPPLSNPTEQTSATSPSTSTTETTSHATFTASSPALSTTSLSTAASWSTLPVLTPSEATDLLRQRRAPSQSPSPSNRLSSSPPTTTTPAKPTSTALTKTSPALLVRKTCALFLGPPANLVATMLRIAARLVASGALNLAEPAFHDLFAVAGNGTAAAATAAGRLRGHRRVPGSWDLSDDDEDWGF